MNTLRHDLPSSLVVFLVAIPLSLGIAIASGAPLVAGLIAAVVGGIIAGSLGGSAMQVSGPAAGLTVIVADLIAKFGWQATCAITIGAGLVQVALGLCRVGHAALVISPAVMHGMLAGIGVTLVLAQLHVVLGDSPQSSALENIRELPTEIAHNHSGAVAVGVMTMALLLLWPRLRRWAPILRYIPAPLIAILTVTVFVVVMGWQVPQVDLPDKPLSTWQFPILPAGQWHGILLAVFSVAMVASVESLLSAVAVDRMHEGPRAALNRELVGQGTANSISGFLGGLPITGVIMRSSTNVAAGAKSRASTILHGVWILIFSLAFAAFIERIPMAALAALLVSVGAQMIKIAHIKHLHKHREVPIYLATLLSVVFFNLLEGVLIGLGLALAMAVWRITRCSIQTENNSQRWHVVVRGSLTFLAVPKLTKTLSEIPRGTAVDLDLNVDFLDHAAFEAIHNWRLGHERLGGQVDIDEMHERWYQRAANGAPTIKKFVADPQARWWAPWQYRAYVPINGNADNTVPVPREAAPMDPLMSGAREFQRRVSREVRPLLAQLAHDGQSPTELFITCADSRVVPNLFTSSGPGDLFTLRNIGNLVPPHDCDDDHSVAAAIEFAVEILGVKSITVCGHSQCGAMAALLNQQHDPAEPTGLRRWLTHGAASLTRFETQPTEVGSPVAVPQEQLCVTNVVQQLDNLLTYPAVSERVKAGKMRLVGMYFDIEQADVYVLDFASRGFAPISR